MKNISKRREINKIKDLEKKQQEQLTEWKENPEQIFNREKQDQINEVKTFAAIKKSKVHKGAKGEVQALEKLSELSDEYHIFCGIKAELPNYITYNGRRNLRTAQLDFVIVSKRGILLVEVKNWSDRFYRNTDKIQPHEQESFLQTIPTLILLLSTKHALLYPPGVTSVLLSIQGNMRYDPNYKFVNVTNLDRINYFIQNRKETFSDNDVKKTN